MPPRTQLDDLGTNPRGDHVLALITDLRCTMVWPGLPLKRNHDAWKTVIGLVTGDAKLIEDDTQKLTLSGSTSRVYRRLDQILEFADSLCNE